MFYQDVDHDESRIAPSPEPASDDSASPINSQPVASDRAYWAGVADGLRRAGLSVPPDIAERAGAPPGAAGDRLAFTPVPLRYREDGLTPEKQRAYVEALADTGVAREAAARVGLSEQAINRVRRRSDACSFDNACEAAHLFGARRLRSIAYERAVEGTLKGHYYHGELISQERVHDNRLLIYLLGKTGHLLEPPAESRAVCDNWEAHMDALEQGLEAPAAPKPVRPDWTGYEVRDDDEGIWWTSFPPPAGFDGEEQGEFGKEGYKRTLSEQEQAVLDAEYDRSDAEYRARETARRDRFFGFAGDEVSSPREAEPNETSEPADPDRGPMEYKSLVPPCPTPPPSFRRTPEPMNAVVRSLRRRRCWLPDQEPPSMYHFDGNPVPDDAVTVTGDCPPSPRFTNRPALPRLHIQSRPPRHPC